MSLSSKTLLRLAAVTALTLAAGLPARAADPQQTRSFQAWKQQDNCATEAFKASPDYTPEGNARRDRLMRLCEAKKHVPIRSDLSDGQMPVRPDGKTE